MQRKLKYWRLQGQRKPQVRSSSTLLQAYSIAWSSYSPNTSVPYNFPLWVCDATVTGMKHSSTSVYMTFKIMLRELYSFVFASIMFVATLQGVQHTHLISTVLCLFSSQSRDAVVWTPSKVGEQFPWWVITFYYIIVHRTTQTTENEAIEATKRGR